MTTVPTPRTFKNIQLSDPNGHIWVSPLTTDSYEEGVAMAKRDANSNDFGLYLILMGPTGAGKSSFIEAINSKSMGNPLDIAKDQLESVTQKPSIYLINNLKRYNRKIFIIDTPGFADPRISELQVLDKVTYWRDMCQDNGLVRILYFHPISDIRMPSTRKRCVDMVQGFWGRRETVRAALVTSMWDRLPERSKVAAERRLTQLSSDHWGDWITKESPALKFENTFDSAMDILDTVCETQMYRSQYDKVSGLGVLGTTCNPVYEALFDRISSLEQQRDMLREDIARPENQGQAELLKILTNDLNKAEILLQQFKTEMNDFLIRFSPSETEPPSTSKTGLFSFTPQAVEPPPSHAQPAPSVRSLGASPPSPQAPIYLTEAGHQSDPIVSLSASLRQPAQAGRPTLRKRFSLWIRMTMDKMRLKRTAGNRGNV